VGEKCSHKFRLRIRLPRNSRDLLHAANLRHGTDCFTSPPKEGVLRIFSPLKIRRLRPGLNLRHLGTKGQHATSRPPKPFSKYAIARIDFVVILIKMTSKMQLCRIIYYCIVPWLLYMFRVILSLIIRSVLTVITASGFIHMHCCRLLSCPRPQPTRTHVNETRSCNYS